MKTNFLKISLWALVFSACCITIMTSCRDDDDAKPLTVQSQIAGSWKFTSFKVDTFEYVGTLVDTATVTFKAFTQAPGDFEQTIVYKDGERDEIKGKYTVDETKKEVSMTARGETEIVKVSFPAADRMDWVTTQDGKPVVAKTRKK